MQLGFKIQQNYECFGIRKWKIRTWDEKWYIFLLFVVSSLSITLTSLFSLLSETLLLSTICKTSLFFHNFGNCMFCTFHWTPLNWRVCLNFEMTTMMGLWEYIPCKTLSHSLFSSFHFPNNRNSLYLHLILSSLFLYFIFHFLLVFFFHFIIWCFFKVGFF